MTEREVLDLLAARYRPPEWAFLRHVANGTGGRKSRTADGIAMNLWPSRGMELHGFEIKVYRGDWLREMKDPAKADEIAARCHRWWVVVSDEAIIQQDDLFPQTWGQMVVRDGSLVVTREAPLLTPAALDWSFLAAVLRRASEAQEVPRPSPRARPLPEPGLTERDLDKMRGRLDRLKATVNRISCDISNALWDLERAEAKAKRAEEQRIKGAA